jgi:hypothetical protein
MSAGWSIKEFNPKVTYDLVMRVTKLTLKSVKMMYLEIGQIKRKKFTIMLDFTNRLRDLKTRLMNNTVIKQPDEGLVYPHGAQRDQGSVP